MKKTTKIYLPILIVVVSFLIMLGLMSLRSETPRKTPEVRAKIVETKIVNLSPVRSIITAYGRVTSTQPIQLYSEVTGIMERGDVPFKPAQSFSKGDLLLKIDDRQATLNLNSAKSDLLNALANVLPEIKLDFPDEYQVWEDYFKNCEFNQKTPELPETDNQRIKLFLSRYNVYSLYFKVRNLEITLDKHYFQAPFDGSIISTSERVGSTVRANSLLGEIINLEQLEVELQVNVADIAWLDRQQKVVFTSSEFPGQWTGKILRIGSDIDDQTQTVKVYAGLDDSRQASLLNGVFLKATIPGEVIDHAVTVPRKALYDEKYVYIIVNGQLERREIVILRNEVNSVIANGGLENGDTLVVELMQGVVQGMPARSKSNSPENREQ
ncbi:MAG: efflux RND transporter periplasmic adaptor subunit [Candidatus Zixiibacteriota bacterium]